MSIENTTPPPAPADGGGSGNETSQIETKQNDPGVQEQKPKETAAERKFRLKFGKTEREADEKEVIMLAQKGWASDEKFKSAKQLEREARKILESADEDALIQKKYGKTKFEWAKEYLKEQLRLKTLPPEEREEFDRKARIKELEEKEAELTRREQERKLAAATEHYQKQYDKELAEAVEKHKVPKNKYVIGRAVKIASEMVDNDLDPDWDLVVGEAKRQVQEEIAESFGDDENSLALLGEDRVRKLMKLLMNKVNSSPQVQAAKIVKQIDANKMGDKVPVDADSYWENKRKQFTK